MIVSNLEKRLDLLKVLTKIKLESLGIKKQIPELTIKGGDKERD